MKLLILLALTLISLNCSSSTEKVSNLNSSNSMTVKSVETQKSYESNFNERLTITEPVPPSALLTYEPIFGKGIRLINHHFSISEKRKKIIKEKAEIKNFTDEQVKEISPGLFYSDFHTLLVYRENKQLALVSDFEIEKNEIIVVYTTQNNQPIIKEIHSKTLPQEFLIQFAGKSKIDQIKIGNDISEIGLDKTMAEKITVAIRTDFWLIQTLYGNS